MKLILPPKDMKTSDKEPLFTLTAEEVEIVKDSLWCLINEYEANEEEYDKADNLLTRINQWQDDNSKKRKRN